jgi:hypothetical protein
MFLAAVVNAHTLPAKRVEPATVQEHDSHEESHALEDSTHAELKKSLAQALDAQMRSRWS